MNRVVQVGYPKHQAAEVHDGNGLVFSFVSGFEKTFVLHNGSLLDRFCREAYVCGNTGRCTGKVFTEDSFKRGCSVYRTIPTIVITGEEHNAMKNLNTNDSESLNEVAAILTRVWNEYIEFSKDFSKEYWDKAVVAVV